jgi:acyl-CoA reductase-like NAD-dependent aldehyde dehydrogenase
MTQFLEKVESIRRRMGDRAFPQLSLTYVKSTLFSAALNPKSTMGSVISPRHLQRIEGMIKRCTGKILVGGERMLGRSALDGFDFSRGSFFPPTIITNINIEDELWQEEVFGPVVVVKRFSVSLPNASRCIPRLRHQRLFLVVPSLPVL